jgi:hypothetical protein
MYRSGNLASVMAYEKEKGVDSELIVFEARKERPPPPEQPVAPYYA